MLGIGTLIVIRQRNHPRVAERKSRFVGSNFAQAYFVESVIAIIGVCIFLIRGFKDANGLLPYPVWAAPISHALGAVLPASLAAISIVAFVKVLVSMVWAIVIARNLTMGIAWHRFTAFFNIYFKREPDGAVALGALKPMMSNGEVLNLEEADPETDTFGAGKVEDFSWKGWLDFNTCTECGRCQSQCPAWNTGKALSPKIVMLQLRDHAFAKAPYLAAGGGKDAEGNEKGTEEQLAKVPAAALLEAERPLVAGADLDGVIDPSVLWDCTTCGACVEQCPVDIEQVDHIVDMRRYQVMIESEFPTELGGLFKNLENKGNPWGQNNRDRMDWAKGLDFEVPVVQGELDDETEYLFWVGCAGAFEDKARKTTRAVAELLHMAGVTFAVLGTEETCTGDPARRAGNEFLFQMMAQQNVEVINAAFGERTRRKVVVSCAHCFNTLLNEYPSLGGRVRGRAPHPAAEPAGPGQEAGRGRPGGPGRRLEDRHRDLPRPLLPGPAQRRLLPAAGADRGDRGDAGRDAPQLRPLVLLRRRRRPHVDGGEDRQADQPRTGGRGAVGVTGRRRREDHHRLPVLLDHAQRRDHHPAERRRGQRDHRDHGCGPHAAGLDEGNHRVTLIRTGTTHLRPPEAVRGLARRRLGGRSGLLAARRRLGRRQRGRRARRAARRPRVGRDVLRHRRRLRRRPQRVS